MLFLCKRRGENQPPQKKSFALVPACLPASQLTATSSRLLWWSLTDKPLSCCCSWPTPWLLRSRDGMNQSWSSSSSISWKQRSKNSCSNSSSSTWKSRNGAGKGGQAEEREVAEGEGFSPHLSVVLLFVLHPHVLGERVGVVTVPCVPVGHRLLPLFAWSSSSGGLGHLWTAHLSRLCESQEGQLNKPVSCCLSHVRSPDHTWRQPNHIYLVLWLLAAISFIRNRGI